MNKLIVNYYLSNYMEDIKPLLHGKGHEYSLTEIRDLLIDCDLSSKSSIIDLLIDKLYPELNIERSCDIDFILLKSYKELDKNEIIEEVNKIYEFNLPSYNIKKIFTVAAIKNRIELVKRIKECMSEDDAIDVIAKIYTNCTDFNFKPQIMQELSKEDTINICNNFKKFSPPLYHNGNDWVKEYTKKYFSFYRYVSSCLSSEGIYNWVVNNVEDKNEYNGVCRPTIGKIEILNDVKNFIKVNLPNRMHNNKIDADFFEAILDSDNFIALSISGMNFLYTINDLLDYNPSTRQLIFHYLGCGVEKHERLTDSFLFKLLYIKARLKKKTANRMIKNFLSLSTSNTFIQQISYLPDFQFEAVLEKINWNTVKDEDLAKFILTNYEAITLLPIDRSMDSKVATILTKNYKSINNTNILPYYRQFDNFYDLIRNAKQRYQEAKTTLFCKCVNFVYKFWLREDSLKDLISIFLQIDENKAFKLYPLARNEDELFACILANVNGLKVHDLNELNKLMFYIKFEGDRYIELYTSVPVDLYIKDMENIGTSTFVKMGIESDFVSKHIDKVIEFINSGLFDICHKYIKSGDVSKRQKESLGEIVKAILQDRYDEIRWDKERLEIELNKTMNDEEYNGWKTDEKRNYNNFSIQDCSDFYSIMTLGEYPVSTCQSYDDGSYNACLLSNFDESKKVLKIFKDGKQIGRAILRLTLSRLDEELNFSSNADSIQKCKPRLTIFVEKLYTCDTVSSKQAMRYMIDFLQEKAKKINAELMFASVYKEFVTEVIQMMDMQTIMVMISATRNQEQYIDSLIGHARKETQYSWHKTNCYTPKKPTNK